METNKSCDWFENWFDSPYYHILYKHRNHKEAELMIDNLVTYLAPAQDASFLDLACGKGRHSVYLNKKGFDVTGIDLSPENIACASSLITSTNRNTLRFFVKDMRKIGLQSQFDFILNLFTSFGYFEDEGDDYDTIEAVSKALKPGGTFILDFMNVQKIIANLVVHEVKIIDDIEFEITKSIENQFIVKRIHFFDKGKEYHFQERVKALTLKDFEKYLSASGFKIVDLRGNYNLEKFEPERSWRLIIIAKKEGY
jgi:SAM-dependent methyltransferase